MRSQTAEHARQSYKFPAGRLLSLRTISALFAFVCFSAMLGFNLSFADPIKLKNSDSFELVRGELADTIFTFGHVRFKQDDGLVYCDSAIWVVDQKLSLWGNVRFKDSSNELSADSIVYNLIDSVMRAFSNVRYRDEQNELLADTLIYNMTDSTIYASGDTVVIISEKDSMYATGRELFYDRSERKLELLGRPVVKFGYHDGVAARSVIADYVSYDYLSGNAIARGEVELEDGQSIAFAQCAQFERNPNEVRLYDSAKVVWGVNELTGDFIILNSAGGLPTQIEVYGNGRALLTDNNETSDSSDPILAQEHQPDSVHNAIPDANPAQDMLQSYGLSPGADSSVGASSSILLGDHLTFSFLEGELSRIDARGQAYSMYNPLPTDSLRRISNTASGDSISLFIVDDALQRVEVYGSVRGEYTEHRLAVAPAEDSITTETADTTVYRGEYVMLDLRDSTIALSGRAEVEQAALYLKADSIHFLTPTRFMKAYSESEMIRHAQGKNYIQPDSQLLSDSGRDTLRVKPFGKVILIDGSQQVDGQYLEYSLVSDKGLIVSSRTGYDQAFYTGSELYRETEDVYFVDAGSYTTCDLETPHFRFWSKHMKLINGDKVIAKPVVLFIEKIPILIIPYYVFPLTKGRWSGILNFRFGNFNEGGRYIANVGYYWAASQYWDIRSSFDYYEVSGPIVRSSLRYNKRYALNGNINAQYAWDSNFDNTFTEVQTRRWFMAFAHRQTLTPTFTFNASGSFVSDSRFFTDFSNELKDRLNRSLRSQINFTKRFGRTSINGSYIRDENLDNKTKRTTYPNLSFSLPQFQPFGTAKKGEDKKWYHTITFSYRGALRRLVTSDENDIFTTLVADTVFDTTFDTTMTGIDTIETLTVTPSVIDTTAFTTSLTHTKYSHGTSVGPSFKVLKYFPVNIRANYNETWFDVGNTDQSDTLNIDTDKLFRSYNYNFSIGVSTNLYGTVTPNIFGLNGLRHTITPSVSYRYTPAISFDSAHNVAAAFVGAPIGSGKAQSVSVGVRQQFDAKIGSGESEKKITLFTASSGASYNPEAVSKPWRDLTTTFQSTLAGKIRLNGSMIHSFYDKEKLKSFNISSTFGAGGSFGSFSSGQYLMSANANGCQEHERDTTGSVKREANDDDLETERKWNISFSHFYSEVGESKSHSLNLVSRLQLTPSVSLSYTQRYDFVRDVTINRYLEIRRKLHCWEGVFEWTPTGSNRGFYFRINVISLPDIKYENTTNSVRGLIY